MVRVPPIKHLQKGRIAETGKCDNIGINPDKLMFKTKPHGFSGTVKTSTILTQYKYVTSLRCALLFINLWIVY